MAAVSCDVGWQGKGWQCFLPIVGNNFYQCGGQLLCVADAVGHGDGDTVIVMVATIVWLIWVDFNNNFIGGKQRFE